MNGTSREEDFIQPCHLENKHIHRYILTLYTPMLSGKKDWKVFFSFSLRRLTLINSDTGPFNYIQDKINDTFSYLLSVKLCDVVDTLYPASRFEHQEKEIGHPRDRECTNRADRRIGNIGQQIQQVSQTIKSYTDGQKKTLKNNFNGSKANDIRNQ